MEQLKLELDAELARFLNKRAHELRRTPDVLVSSLLTHWLRIAHEKEPLGSDEGVQDRMAKIAEHYADESREMLEDHPDLGLDAADPPQGATHRRQLVGRAGYSSSFGVESEDPEVSGPSFTGP